MINTKELRRENTINTPYGIHKVYGVNPELVQINIEGTVYDFDPEDVEPIILTKEILLEREFILEPNGFYYSKGKLILSFEENYNDGRTYFNSWAILDKVPKYLHKLENLYLDLHEKEL